MDFRQRQQLVSSMMKIIEFENLPKPERICIRNPMYGTKTVRGSCKKLDYSIRYRINVSITEAQFVPSETGNYVSKLTGEKRKRVMGKVLPIDKIIEVSAHEIAHLRHWNHGPQHASYTLHLKKMLGAEMGLKL